MPGSRTGFPEMQLTRLELYLLLWQRPATDVADELGISSSALKKVCRTHQIPTPGRGYWRKREIGEPPPVREPLPEPERNEVLAYQVGEQTAAILKSLELSGSSPPESSTDAAEKVSSIAKPETARRRADPSANPSEGEFESREPSPNTFDLLAPTESVLVTLAKRHRELDDVLLFLAALEVAVEPRDPATQAVVRLWVELARASLPCGPISEVVEMCRLVAHGEDLPRWWQSVPRTNLRPRGKCCAQMVARR
jgi:hypothetical protein